MATKKQITDSLRLILTRFGITDDSRLDPDYLSYMVDKVRADLIVRQYSANPVIDFSWLSEGSLLTFHKVDRADNVTVMCDCDISKTTIPQTITLQGKDGNLDLGVYSLISTCGKTTYYQSRLSQFRYIPEGHTHKLFGKYARINTTLYVDRVVEKLRATWILLEPEDGFLINSAPVVSGSIVLGTVYIVKYGQVFYDGVMYKDGQTFTGTAATTFSGSATIYLYSQLVSYRDTDPYPAGGDMVRMIELEILTKEFGIERQQIADIRNDSKDDASKAA